MSNTDKPSVAVGHPGLAVDVGSAFNRWWHDEGSGMSPKPNEDAETHVRRITEIAWSNGAYLEQLKTEKYAEELQQIAEALGMPFSSGRALVDRVRELASPNNKLSNSGHQPTP